MVGEGLPFAAGMGIISIVPAARAARIEIVQRTRTTDGLVLLAFSNKLCPWISGGDNFRGTAYSDRPGENFQTMNRRTTHTTVAGLAPESSAHGAGSSWRWLFFCPRPPFGRSSSALRYRHPFHPLPLACQATSMSVRFQGDVGRSKTQTQPVISFSAPP